MDTTPKIKNQKAMPRDEVLYFVDLVQHFAILTSKETNATTNKMKEEAWNSLAVAFNAKCGGFPKQKEQLKLKWDNLKKAARKRNQAIRTNMLKPGAGNSDFIPHDEILDRVSSLIESTSMGLEVPCGGDGIDPSLVLKVEVDSSEETIESNQNIARVQMPHVDLQPSTAKKRKDNSMTPEGDIEEANAGVKFLHGVPTMAKSLQNKDKKKKIDDGRLERNLAIAKYYDKKSEKLDLEIKLLKIELTNKEGKKINNLVL